MTRLASGGSVVCVGGSCFVGGVGSHNHTPAASCVMLCSSNKTNKHTPATSIRGFPHSISCVPMGHACNCLFSHRRIAVRSTNRRAMDDEDVTMGHSHVLRPSHLLCSWLLTDRQHLRCSPDGKLISYQARSPDIDGNVC